MYSYEVNEKEKPQFIPTLVIIFILHVLHCSYSQFFPSWDVIFVQSFPHHSLGHYGKTYKVLANGT